MRRRDFGRILLMAAGGITYLATGRFARAVQPPMSKAEISEQSDAVIVCDVIGVACQEESADVPRYAAWVQVREVFKGQDSLATNMMLNLEFCQLRGPFTGGVEVLLYAGERAKLYLMRDGSTFTLWHQDGKQTLVAAPPATHRLPQGSGTLILATNVGNQSQPPRRGWVRR